MLTYEHFPRKKTRNGVAYFHAGSGIPVVMLHGVGLSADSWYHQKLFLENNYQLYGVDLPGHGQSTCTANSLDDFTHIVRHFIETTVKEPPILIGHSMGAMLALHCCSKLSCLGIISLNAIAYRSKKSQTDILQRVKKLEQGDYDIEAPLARWFGDEHDNEKEKCRTWLMHIITNNPSAYLNAYRVFATNDAPSVKSMSAIKAPALLITGDKDFNSTPSMSSELASSMKKANAHIIKGAGHLMPLTHSAALNPCIQQFLNNTLHTSPC